MTFLKNIKQFLIKYNLIDFKTRNHKLAIVAMTVNFGAAAFKIIAAFYISSYFLIVSSFYSLGIAMTLQMFFRGVNRTNLIQTKEKKYVLLMYGMLFVSSLVYLFYMVRLFYIHVSEFNYGMIISLGIAVVSFTELGIAIRGLVKSYFLKDPLLTARKIVTLTSAFVAIVLTQSAILTFTTNDGTSHQIYNAILGVVVGVAASLLALVMLIKNAKMNNKPLEQMTLEELWQLFPIFLVPHKNAWSKRYEREKRYLFNHLTKKNIKGIEHIGSTAIEGIQAKDIIDILIVIDGRKKIMDIALLMKRLGYTIMSESDQRISLNKGYTKHGFARDVFHVHLRYRNDCDEILFRDYLNAHPEFAKDYEILKLDLADIYKHNRDAYTDAKTDFVKKIIAKAKTEFKKE